jgi:hypothetical protein
MKIRYAQQPLEKSLFLAGPTPRSPNVPSWRPEACRILADLGFTGTVFVPEPDGFLAKDSYDDQVSWEWEGLNQATAVVFWVPRDLATMPGFTTNIEFGHVADSGKLVLGYPEGAPKMRYFDKMAQRYHLPIHRSLRATLEEAVRRTRIPFGEH